MNIISVNPLDDPRWAKLVHHHPSDAFHTPEWMRVLADTYDFEVRAYIGLDDAGEPAAGIPFCLIEDMKGKRLRTLPFSDYCDPLVGSPEAWHCLVDRLLAEQLPYTIRCLHNEIPLADERFSCANKAKWHGLDLQPDIDLLWRSLHNSARRAIKKAQRGGVEIRVADSIEQMRAFFEMHLGVRKHKYRMVAQPYRFFEKIWHHFVEQDSGLLLTAVYQGKTIGAVLFLEWKNKLYYKFNASDPAHLAQRPNDLLIWEGIKYAKSKGYTYLDFGLSDWDQDGLIRYKQKFATDEKTISYLHYAPDAERTAAEKQLQTLLPQLTGLFTDESVPDHITEKAGDLLYRFFS